MLSVLSTALAPGLAVLTHSLSAYLGCCMVYQCGISGNEEDPVHFLAVNALQAQHQALLSHTPLSLPDPSHDSSAVMEIYPGTPVILENRQSGRPKRSSSNTSLTLNRKDPIYLSTNREYSTYPNKKAAKRKTEEVILYAVQC